MERKYHPNRGFQKWRYPKMVSLCHGNSHRSKWMITRGSPILGKPPNEQCDLNPCGWMMSSRMEDYPSYMGDCNDPKTGNPELNQHRFPRIGMSSMDFPLKFPPMNSQIKSTLSFCTILENTSRHSIIYFQYFEYIHSAKS